MLKIKQINPESEGGLFGGDVIDKPLNNFINSLRNKGNEIRRIKYISDKDGLLIMAIVEYYEDEREEK